MTVIEYRRNPVKAIREKCLDCSGGSHKEVEKCTLKDCPVCPFRMGTNPYRTKREMTEEQRVAAAERLAAARAAREEK